MSSLKNQVALITGAASGIGQATAVHFASFGCYLSLVDVDEVNLKKTQDHCIEQGLRPDKILLQTGDLTDHRFLETLVKNTAEYFSQLDVLVNCAGIMLLNQPLMTTSVEEFDRTMNLNFKTYLRLTQLVVAHLKLTKGRIVNVSSRLAKFPMPNCLPYLVSKAGVDMLTKASAQELSEFGIRVNSVNPSMANTNLLRYSDKFDQMCDVKGKLNLMGRIPEAFEIAKPIAFLASDDSSFITGVNLQVDGGLTFRS